MGWASPSKNSQGTPIKVHGLITFKSLVRAVKAGDWKTAAQYCHRRDSHSSKDKRKPSHAAQRNAWTKELFEQADRFAHPQGPLHVGH